MAGTSYGQYENGNNNYNNSSSNSNNSNSNPLNINSNNQSAQNNYDEGNTFDNSSEENIDESEDLNIAADESMTGSLRHPVAASRWRTRELVLTARLPEQPLLFACQEEIKALATKAINHEMMISSRNILSQAIARKSEIYHWCFYYTVMTLDTKLDNMNMTLNFKEKHQYFVDEMKALWILARGLDAVIGSKKYFGYLRRRYIGISRAYFGKHVEVISSPLGDRGKSLPWSAPKGAAAYDENANYE